MNNLISNVRRHALAAIAILFAGLVLTSCLKDDDDTPNPPAAGLMAFNLSPDVAAAGFSISGNNLTSMPLGFNSYTGTYLAIFPGTRSVESYNFNSGNTIATASREFGSERYYSVFLVGADSSYSNIIVEDMLDSLSGTGKAFIRYINAIPDASDPSVTIAVNGTNVVNENADFTSVSEFTAVDPGSAAITVSNGGSINANRTINLEAQKIYTIMLIGEAGGTGDQAVQIKFIQNGMIDGTAGRSTSATVRSVN